MSKFLDVNGLKIAQDFTFAEVPDGGVVNFTRAEARAISLLSQNSGRLISRTQILDSVSEPGSDTNDRNVDFLINRLRRKLSDNIKDPRFIATRYGEGYVWVAGKPTIQSASAHSNLVIGPLRGLENLGSRRSFAESFSRKLFDATKAAVKPGQSVSLDPQCPEPEEFGETAPEVSVALTFFVESHHVNCVIAVTNFRSRRILAARRCDFAEPAGELGGSGLSPQELARWVLDEVWRARVSQVDADEPLPVALQAATTRRPMDTGSPADDYNRLRATERLVNKQSYEGWLDSERHLCSLRDREPTNPDLKLMYATHLHSKYVLFGVRLFQNGIDDRERDEEIIETLVLEALPHIQSDPQLAITAAKLLFFLDRGYNDLATNLAEEAHRASILVASSMSIVAQMRAFNGQTREALESVEQAVRLCRHNSDAHLFACVIKMQILMAAGDFERLGKAKREFYALHPASIFFFEPLFSNPCKPSLRAKSVCLMIPKKKAQAFLKNFYYVSARLFKIEEHRENSIRTPYTLFTKRFGPSVVPAEVAAAVPRLAAADPFWPE